MPVRRRHIRATVERLLMSHRIRSAPVPVEQLAKALGVQVHYQPAEESLSGFILRDHAKRQTVIGVNSTHHVNRKRFTVAHELGHFLLHDLDHVHVDRADCGFLVRHRNAASSSGDDDHEKEANLFAAELLMPVSFLQEDVESLGDIDLLDDGVLVELGEKYRVSTQALTFRLANLGYVQL